MPYQPAVFFFQNRSSLRKNAWLRYSDAYALAWETDEDCEKIIGKELICRAVKVPICSYSKSCIRRKEFLKIFVFIFILFLFLF